ncbi:MAG: DUF1343 domain-containing protein [Myxococcales bacterium]|nr:DUF1343 domain-containing protein [Myxococcales bacterium]MCB9644105.1 DUF1343 domain-containing protein [Myxococcales bacterium]
METEVERLKGRRVGICCNPTAVDAKLRHIVSLMKAVPDVELVALFGPEHGIRGEAQDMISVEGGVTDPETGVPIYSLYGDTEASLRPKPEWLDGLDVVLFDIQDVGSRYYTYVYTMSYLMEVAGKVGVEVWVLDRPNPINGLGVEGPSVQDAFRSFVGHHPLPNRHGMTAGELALYFRDICGVSCQLEIIKMEGWTRDMWFDQTGLPWVMPSPNMPTLDTATVYPGGCLFEGTNLSEARGTTRPFELVGAAYLDPFAFAAALEQEELPGVFFRPLRFMPTFHKWGRQSNGGVQIHVTDRESFLPLLTGVAILKAAKKVSPDDFAWRTETYEFVSDRLAIDLLFGGAETREALESGATLREIEKLWQEEQSVFLEQRKPFLLYR